MIKTILICSLLCSTLFAQDLQSLVNQVNAATGNFLGQVGDLSQVGDSINLILNEYEWSLTEQNGEYELNVNALPYNSNNLGPALSGLLANVGDAAQNNAEDIGNLLSTEASGLGVVVQDGGSLGQAASQYGEQLQDNAESVSASLQNTLSQLAADISSNNGGINDQLNQQINQAIQNPEGATQSVENLVSGALANLPSSIPTDLVQVNGDTTPLAEAAANLAANVDPTQAVDAFNSLASSATGVVNSLPSDVAGAVNSAANGAANSASAAANDLGATDAINNLSATVTGPPQ